MEVVGAYAALLGAQDVKDAKTVEAAIADCMTWPDDLIACMSDPKRLSSPECKRAGERAAGLVSSEPAAAGPAPRWKRALPFDVVRTLRVANTIVLGGDSGILALVAGKVAWATKGSANAALVEIAGERCVLAVGDKDAACFALATGRVELRASLPPRKAWDDDITFAAGAALDDTIILTTSTLAMYALSPPACKRRAPECLAVSGELPDSGADEIVLLPSKARVLSNVSHVYLTDARGAPITTFSGTLVEGITIEPTGRVIVAASKKLLHLDTTACAATGNAPIPIDGSACTTTLFTFKQQPGIPLVLDDAMITVVDTQLHRVGSSPWRLELGTMSAPILAGDKLYVIAQDGSQGPVELRAIDPATGTTTWSTILTGSTQLTNAHLVATDTEVVAIVGFNAYGFALTKAP
jgi:hypothetical protein